MKAKVGKTYLSVPHEKGERTFQHPSFRGNYAAITEAIKKSGLRMPSSSETASLIYDSFKNPKGEYESQIISLLKNSWCLEATGNLYLPKSNEEVNNGVILDLNPEFKNGRLSMDKNSLIKRLQKGDDFVKFVPFGFKTGVQKTSELEKNPYIQARYGEEGAQKIAQIASKHKLNPGLWSFDSVEEEIKRVAGLYSNYFDDRLVVDTFISGDFDYGFSFGVSEMNKGK